MRPNASASVERIRDLAARKCTSAMKQKSNLHFIKYISMSHMFLL